MEEGRDGKGLENNAFYRLLKCQAAKRFRPRQHASAL